MSIPGVKAEWLTLPLGGLKAEALLVVPDNVTKPVPLVIAQHGIDSYPERVFGVADDGNYYHDYGHILVNEGFAVLAPINLSYVPNRNRMERLARLADTTLPGIEFRRMQLLLDEVLRTRESTRTALECGVSAWAAWPPCSGCRSNPGSNAE